MPDSPDFPQLPTGPSMQETEVTIRQDSMFRQWSLDKTPITVRFEHMIRGNRYVEEPARNADGDLEIDPQTQQPYIIGYWKKPEKPRMAEEAVSIIMGVFETYVNPISMISDYEDEDIRRYIANLREELAEWIVYKGKKYSIDNDERDLIVEEIVRFVEFALRKSRKAGERKSISGEKEIYRRDVMTPAQGQKKRLGVI